MAFLAFSEKDSIVRGVFFADAFAAGCRRVGPNTVARLCNDILFSLLFCEILKLHGIYVIKISSLTRFRKICFLLTRTYEREKEILGKFRENEE